MQQNNIIHYFENGVLKMISTGFFKLKKEHDGEVLFTSEGNKIPLSDLISLNGFTWN